MMRILFFFFIILNQLSAQPLEIAQPLFDQYETFEEKTIHDRRFKHSDIQPLLEILKTDAQFKIRHLGQSIEGRDISLVSIGQGKTNVLLWSQMHGDEPTATMAIMDIFNFFSRENEFEKIKALLKKELTLHFIPMLNPDGAERFQRRNVLGIDLNRDALRLQSPEAKILKQVRDELNADWGFNLHDQNRYYAAGINPATASISFLAPAYNYEKEVNTIRGNAMRMIGVMNTVLQKYIPGKVGRYNDDFEPRAFGDNIQKWGTSTILIEAGGLENDREKQFLRKLHFVILLSSFHAIATNSYKKVPIKNYNKIPFNDSNAFHDLVIRNANIKKREKSYIVDIGLRHHEIEFENNRQFYFKSKIHDIGDLSTSYGYEEFDASEYQLEPGRVYPKVIKNMEVMKTLNLMELLKKGYTNFQMKELPPAWEVHQLAIRLSPYDHNLSNQIAIGNNPSLLFIKDGTIRWVLINGQMVDLKQDSKK